jgi:hypothetical protein
VVGKTTATQLILFFYCVQCVLYIITLYAQASEAATDTQDNAAVGTTDDNDAVDSDSDSDDSTTIGGTKEKESRRAAKKRHEQELHALLAEEGHVVSSKANNSTAIDDNDGNNNEDTELSNESAVVLDRLTGQPFATDILMHAVSSHQLIHMCAIHISLVNVCVYT